MRDVADSPAGHHDEQTFAEWRVELHHKALVQREHRKLGSLIWRMHEQSIAGHMHELLQQSFRRREEESQKGTFYFTVKVECPLLLSFPFAFPYFIVKVGCPLLLFSGSGLRADPDMAKFRK